MMNWRWFCKSKVCLCQRPRNHWVDWVGTLKTLCIRRVWEITYMCSRWLLFMTTGSSWGRNILESTSKWKLHILNLMTQNPSPAVYLNNGWLSNWGAGVHTQLPWNMGTLLNKQECFSMYCMDHRRLGKFKFKSPCMNEYETFILPKLTLQDWCEDKI